MQITTTLFASIAPYEGISDQHSDFFRPESPKEFNYLVDEIQAAYPNYTKMAIALAIHSASYEFPGTGNRRAFVQHVTGHLLMNPPFRK